MSAWASAGEKSTSSERLDKHLSPGLSGIGTVKREKLFGRGIKDIGMKMGTMRAKWEWELPEILIFTTEWLLKSNSIEEVGVFRVSGSQNQVAELKTLCECSYYSGDWSWLFIPDHSPSANSNSSSAIYHTTTNVALTPRTGQGQGQGQGPSPKQPHSNNNLNPVTRTGSSSNLSAESENSNTNNNTNEYLKELLKGHNVANILKIWLRELPEPLFHQKLFKPLSEMTEGIEFKGEGKERDEVFKKVEDLLERELEKENRHTLNCLFKFLKKVARQEEKNKMGASNLALIFRPNIISPPDGVVSVESMTSVGITECIKQFIVWGGLKKPIH